MAIKLIGQLIVIIIENVFWDLDGTLIDSEAIHEEAADYALEIMGVAKPALAIPTGLENAAGFELLFGVSVLEEPQLFARFEELVIEYAYLRISREQQITPAVELFRHFAEIGMPQSVVSNSGQFLVEHSLRQLGILELCVGVFSRDSVNHGKPNPQLYRNALALHQATPATSLTFEDSRSGILAAKAAGVNVIGVGLASQEYQPDHICLPEQAHWLAQLNDKYLFRGKNESGIY